MQDAEQPVEHCSEQLAPQVAEQPWHCPEQPVHPPVHPVQFCIHPEEQAIVQVEVHPEHS